MRSTSPRRFNPLRPALPFGLGLGLLFLVAFCPTAAARQGNAVWGGLVFATNQPGQTSGRYDLHPYAKRLRTIFGYQFYELLESDRQLIQPTGVQRLQLGRDYTIRLRFLGIRPGGAAFAMELSQGSRRLVASDVVLGRDSPFVIRGPQWGKGQVLFLLMVR